MDEATSQPVSAKNSSLMGTFKTVAAFAIPHIALIYGFAAFPSFEEGFANLLPGIEHSGEHAMTLTV